MIRRGELIEECGHVEDSGSVEALGAVEGSDLGAEAADDEVLEDARGGGGRR